jgi:hypothetical protein
MSGKLLGALVILLFLLGSIVALIPISAHSTLGDYTPSFSFHLDDFDPHVSGPTAYVFPGSGLAAWAGTPNGFPPGYQNPYSGNPPGLAAADYQLSANAYSPFGAILTSTEDHADRGPLVIALNFSNPCDAAFTASGIVTCSGNTVTGGVLLNYTGMTVYVPPEFDLSSAESNYGLIQSTFSATNVDWFLTKATMQDPIGPGWWVLTFQGNIRFWPQHHHQEWYYARINDVVAPKIAGKYFFKVFLWDENMAAINAYQIDVPGSWDINSAILGSSNALVPFSGPTVLTVPVENWPVLLVKGEVDPGIITGTIRYGGYNQTLYGRPINLPGKVWVTGLAVDPYTREPTGRKVEAMGYFNASAAGHFEVEGVAPGIYDLYASAGGYPQQLIGSQITILPGQSFHLDGYLNPGAIVRGQVFSKHLFGEEPWPQDPRPISIDIYSSNDYSDDNIVAWSPWNKTHAPYMAYDWPKGSSLPQPMPVAYPWDTLSPATGSPFALSYYGPRTFSTATTASYLGSSKVCGGAQDQCGKPDGVGPAQYWWVDGQGVFTNGGGSDSFIFQFGVTGVYGAPRDIDGHVPQPYATWVNGLTPGRYWVRAWLNGYVQTKADGVTLDEYSFDVSDGEWAGDVFVPMDLRVSSVINKTIHFHDQPGTLQECPIDGCAGNRAIGWSAGPRYLIAELRDPNGNLAGINFTLVEENANQTHIEVDGFGMMGPDPFSKFDDGTGMKFSYYRYQRYHDYGLPSGTYTMYVYMRGYLDTPQSVTVTLSGSPALISDNMYRGARLNITVYSIDWEHPAVTRVWSFPTARLRLYVVDQDGHPYRIGDRFWQPASGPTKRIFTGNCALRPGEVADHCRIVDWDGSFIYGGYPSSPFFDTPPDVSSSSLGFSFSGYQPFVQLYNLDIITGRPLNEAGYAGPISNGFLFYPTYYRRGADEAFKADDVLPTGTYRFYGFTYGYVQHQEFEAYVQEGAYADVQMQLLRGVNLTLNIDFEKEGILTPTDANMSMRVRVFNDQGQLIATAQSKAPDLGFFWAIPYLSDNPRGIARWDGAIDITWDGSDWTYYVDPFAVSPSTGNDVKSVDPSRSADTFLWYGNYYGTGDSWQAFDSDVNGDGTPDFSYYNFEYYGYTAWIPAGTKQVRVFLAGVYDFNDPLNSLYSGVLHGATLDSKYDWQMYGIDGHSSTLPSSYAGGYSVEVDTWNEYPNATFTAGSPNPTNWYRPVEGLLEGDSFHTVPGSEAGPFGYTGSALASNGLGPYSQGSTWALLNTPLGGEASAIFHVDKRGYISGNIYGFTASNTLRTESWVTVQAVSATGNAHYTQNSRDGFYDMYLNPGQYAINVIAWTPSGNEAYKTVSTAVSIADGQSSTGVNFTLETSGIPIPEFNWGTVVFASALVDLLYIRVKRKHRAPHSKP